MLETTLRAVGMKRAKSLYEAAQNTIGCTEGESCTRMEIKLLLQDYHNKTAHYYAVMDGHHTKTLDVGFAILNCYELYVLCKFYP